MTKSNIRLLLLLLFLLTSQFVVTYMLQTVFQRTTYAIRSTKTATATQLQLLLLQRPSFLYRNQKATMSTTTTTTTALSNGAKNDVPTSYGVDMDQNALMETDMLVAVNEHDIVIPNTILSKKMGHIFTEQTPRATLHRAFSFFLFNHKNELLLTQRASSKITFPNVWTNTVCSHPLVGMTPNEVDDTNHDYPHYPGIKHAAIRKCYHELGIPYNTIDTSKIQFITKFHYWAADTITYGNTNDCSWGEHEIDYILFYQIDNENDSNNIVSSKVIQPNPEEVSDYKFVTIHELRTMLQDPNLLWSPWFIGIMERGGFTWWEHLITTSSSTTSNNNGSSSSSSSSKNTLQEMYTNRDITYFNPPSIHYAPYNHNETHTPLTGVLSIPTTTTTSSSSSSS